MLEAQGSPFPSAKCLSDRPAPGGQAGRTDVAERRDFHSGPPRAPGALTRPPAPALTAPAADSLPSQSSAFTLISSQDCGCRFPSLRWLSPRVLLLQ